MAGIVMDSNEWPVFPVQPFSVGDRVNVTINGQKVPGRISEILDEQTLDRLKSEQPMIIDGVAHFWSDFKYSIFIGKDNLSQLARQSDIEIRE